MKTYYNYTFKIIEMRDEMERTVENVEKNLEEYEYLISTLKNLNDDKFTELVSSLEKTFNTYKEQLPELEKRLEKVNYLVELLKDEKNWQLACVIFESLGIFKREDYEHEEVKEEK